MPAGDGTGPEGLGPMTGRAAGHCAGYDTPGYANPIPGRGLGIGRGRRGRGRRRQYYASELSGWARFGYNIPPTPPTAKQEAGFLKAQAEQLQAQLEATNQRIAALEKET